MINLIFIALVWVLLHDGKGGGGNSSSGGGGISGGGISGNISGSGGGKSKKDIWLSSLVFDNNMKLKSVYCSSDLNCWVYLEQ